MSRRDVTSRKKQLTSDATELGPLNLDFFARPSIVVARELLGCVMTRRVDGVLRQARLIETEAYLGPSDLASHSSKGLTRRTAAMFGPPGRAYVYFIYGMHTMLNVVCGVEGEAQAVLLRAAEPLGDWPADLTGPGRLARAFDIRMTDYGLDLLAGDLTFLADAAYRPHVERRKRVGVDYAGRWKDRLLRFVDAKSSDSRKLKR